MYGVRERYCSDPFSSREDKMSATCALCSVLSGGMAHGRCEPRITCASCRVVPQSMNVFKLLSTALTVALIVWGPPHAPSCLAFVRRRACAAQRVRSRSPESGGWSHRWYRTGRTGGGVMTQVSSVLSFTVNQDCVLCVPRCEKVCSNDNLTSTSSVRPACRACVSLTKMSTGAPSGAAETASPLPARSQTKRSTYLALRKLRKYVGRG